MSEDKTQAATETVSESPATETPQPSPNDELIAESKKYRKRAQDAESRLSELEKKFNQQEESKLKEKEEFKTLYEQASSKVESLTSNAEKWTKYEETKRASLLESHPEDERESLSANSEKWAKYEEAKRASLIEQHPEDDREALAGLPLDTLEYVTSKINNVKANAPEVLGNPRGVKDIPSDWNKMDADELRNNWGDIVASAKARMKK